MWRPVSINVDLVKQPPNNKVYNLGSCEYIHVGFTSEILAREYKATDQDGNRGSSGAF